MSDVFQFLHEGDGRIDCDGIHVVTKVPGKIGDCPGGCLCVDQADLLDHVQDIEEEMGLDLAEHEIDLHLFIVQFLFSKDGGLFAHNKDEHDHHGNTGSQGYQINTRTQPSEEKTQNR